MCAFHTALTGSSHTFMTWISPPHWAPSLRLHLLMNFHSVSLHVSLSLPHLSMTLWRCYRPHFPHSLNKQWAGLGRGGHGGVGWDRHWIITSSHSFQRKNDGKKKDKIKHDAAHQSVDLVSLMPLFSPQTHTHSPSHSLQSGHLVEGS